MMKPTLLMFIVALLLLNCQTNAKNQGQRELVPHPEKYVHDGYLELHDSIKPQFKPDTMIGPISLIDPTHVEDYLGGNVKSRLIEDDGLPNASVISSDSKQRFRFYFHPGNGENDYSEFEVSYVQQITANDIRIKDQEFTTESGIKLGMTMGALRALKGEPHSITEKETTTFHYKIDDYDTSDFLLKYNMPVYYAHYEFSNGYLIAFKFGFDYP